MKNLVFIFFFLIGTNAGLTDKDKDPLNKRIFLTNVTEIKNDIPSNKTFSDELEFKNAKLFSDFLNKKFDIGWMKYVITKDTTYIDSVLETEVRYIEVKASYKDADNQITSVFCKIENENIEGEIKITKNDKLKKQFEFYGTEKASRIKETDKK